MSEEHAAATAEIEGTTAREIFHILLDVSRGSRDVDFVTIQDLERDIRNCNNMDAAAATMTNVQNEILTTLDLEQADPVLKADGIDPHPTGEDLKNMVHQNLESFDTRNDQNFKDALSSLIAQGLVAMKPVPVIEYRYRLTSQGLKVMI